MLNKYSLALAAVLTALPQMVLAEDDAAGRCVDVSVPKQVIESRNGKWIELTPEQWEFLRGIYAMNPLTPPGLPYGDKAVLAKVEGSAGGAWCSSSTATRPARRCRFPTRFSR
jgi:hypothetical protein